MFYLRLKQLCESHHITLTEMTQKYLGTGNSTATAWKKGACPRSDVVIKAAQYFSVTTDYLLGLSDIPERPKEELNSSEYEMLRAFRAADPSLRTAALAVLNTTEPKGRGGAAKLSTSRNADFQDAL